MIYFLFIHLFLVKPKIYFNGLCKACGGLSMGVVDGGTGGGEGEGEGDPYCHLWKILPIHDV